MESRRYLTFKAPPHKMVKDTETIRWQQSTNCLSVFDHFARLAHKGLNSVNVRREI